MITADVDLNIQEPFEIPKPESYIVVSGHGTVLRRMKQVLMFGYRRTAISSCDQKRFFVTKVLDHLWRRAGAAWACHHLPDGISLVRRLITRIAKSRIEFFDRCKVEL